MLPVPGPDGGVAVVVVVVVHGGEACMNAYVHIWDSGLEEFKGCRDIF